MRVSAIIVIAVTTGLAGCLWLSRAAPLPAGVSRYSSPQIDEASGLVPSVRTPGVYWTHNDSGDQPRLFATTVTGSLLAEFEIDGAGAVDWETITVDPSGHLYIGDTGNNKNTRRDLSFYRVLEPKLDVERSGVVGRLKVDRRLQFHYPEQKEFPDTARLNFDCEASFWAKNQRAQTGALYVLTKHRSDQRTVLYRFGRLDADSSLPLEKIGAFDLGGDPRNFGGMATGAAISTDGRYLAVLSYHAIFIFERPETGDNYLAHLKNRIDLSQGQTQQVEAIAWDGRELVFTNEQAMIFRVRDPLRPRTGTFPPQEERE